MQKRRAYNQNAYLPVLLALSVSCTVISVASARWSFPVMSSAASWQKFERFPACVEVVEVIPYPHSVLLRGRSEGEEPYYQTVKFHITFSRPMKFTQLLDLRGAGGGVFLTTNTDDLTSVYRPSSLQPASGGKRVLVAKFRIPYYLKRIVRKLYLVVDGNSLPNNHADSVLPIYAPMSIFGEYYLELNDAQGKLPHPIHRSPYCRPQSAKRPFLSPSLPRKRKNPTVAFPLSGHRLVEEKGASHQNESGLEAYTLLLSVLLHGDIGNIHADLPHSVVSEFQGYNVTVEIPSQNKKFSRSLLKYYTVPADVHLLRVPRERIIQDIRGKKNYRQCPAGSRRSLGHAGTIYHTLEPGSIYRMLMPRPIDEWRGISLSNSIPTTLSDAVSSHVCLFQPEWVQKDSRRNEIIDFVLNLEQCVWVPREKVRREECGGLQVWKKALKIVEEPGFCSRSFGTCVGAPLSSLEHYPVLPPFGLTELAGWFADFSPLPVHLRYDAAVPEGLSEKARPRAQYLHSRGSIRLVPQLFSEQVEITIAGVRIAEPSIAAAIPSNYDYSDGSAESVAYDPSSSLDANCNTMWRLESGVAEMEAKLTASVLNGGTGGGLFIAAVICTKHLFVYPPSGVLRQWIEPGEEATISFTLGGSHFARIRHSHHKCECGIKIEAPPGLFSSANMELPPCTRRLTTHHGSFQDPCTLPASPLPKLDIRYYVLPPSLSSQSPSLKRFLHSPIGKSLVLVKTIVLSVAVFPTDKSLLPNLRGLRAACLSGDILLLSEARLETEASLASQDPGHRPSRSPLTFHTNITVPRTFYFFNSTADQEKERSSSTTPASGCMVEVWANQPHRLCKSGAVRYRWIHVPLAPADVSVTLVEASHSKTLWPLVLVYGEKPVGLLATLLLCLASSAILAIAAAVGYGILAALGSRFPTTGKLITMKKMLKETREADQYYWEEPEVYLQPGPHGPHYILHDFCASGDLDTDDLSGITVSGLLRCQTQAHRQLTVAFGRVEQLFVEVDQCEGMRSKVWLQASSGMYLLQGNHTASNYSDQFLSFLERRRAVLQPLLGTPGLRDCHIPADVKD